MNGSCFSFRLFSFNLSKSWRSRMLHQFSSLFTPIWGGGSRLLDWCPGRVVFALGGARGGAICEQLRRLAECPEEKQGPASGGSCKQLEARQPNVIVVASPRRPARLASPRPRPGRPLRLPSRAAGVAGEVELAPQRLAGEDRRSAASGVEGA